MQVLFLDGSSREVTLAPDANLRTADLRYANLRYANLRSANLCDADLCGADLSGADLSGADLRYANLCGADLRYANLCDANLSGADLSGANLSYANLSYANLCDANLHGANISDCVLPKDYNIARLDFGGWPVTVTPTETSISCQTYGNEKWLSAKWNSLFIRSMDTKASRWWKSYGGAVREVIRTVMRKQNAVAK